MRFTGFYRERIGNYRSIEQVGWFGIFGVLLWGKNAGDDVERSWPSISSIGEKFQEIMWSGVCRCSVLEL